MKTRWKWLLPVLTWVVPAMLILSAVRTYLALDGQRSVYLRSRAAALAAHLETIPSALPEAEWAASLADEETALEGLAIYDRGAAAPELEAIWNGRELFRTERVQEGGVTLYRAFVPFHAAGNGALRIARIDLREDAAGFLTEHARHHLWLVLIGGAMILVLSYLNAEASRRAIEAERRQVELARIGQMSAVLAHEIRNPLGTIKGYAQLLGEQLRGNAEQAELLSPILSETSRLEELVRDLLLYGRPAEPSLGVVRSEDVARMLGEHASMLGGGVRVELPEFQIRTDGQLLEQILLNLLRNAVDASPQSVRISARVSPQAVEFAVEDDGPGFSAEALQRLYEPFYTSKASGTGLGLSVSRKLTESLGGRLTVANRAAGGARVELHLPVGGVV